MVHSKGFRSQGLYVQPYRKHIDRVQMKILKLPFYIADSL